GMLPQLLTRIGGEAEYSLLSSQLIDAAGIIHQLSSFYLVVHDKDSTRRHGWTAVAVSDGDAPFDGQTLGRNRRNNPRLSVHAIPLRTQPLRPIITSCE